MKTLILFFILLLSITIFSQGPGPATDPVPASGSESVSITLSSLSWTNPTGAISCDVYFGQDLDDLFLIHTGSLVNSISISGLFYATTYYWKVNEIDGSGTTTGSTWNFTTERDPDIVTLLFDDFENGLSNWTIINNGGTCDWDLFYLISRGYTMPPAAIGNAFAADVDFCGSGTSINSSAIAGPIDATDYPYVEVSFDNDFRILGADECLMDISTNGGATWSNVFHWTTENRNTHEYYVISSIVGWREFYVKLTSIQPDWDWWWAIDNFKIVAWECFSSCVGTPTYLTATGFYSGLSYVSLEWKDHSYNEMRFIIERKLGDSLSTNFFEMIDSVAENVTSYLDYSILDTTIYTYRVWADGGGQHSRYSNMATVMTLIPVKLTSFTATIERNIVSLNWQTATETNNSGFEIQRSLTPTPSQREGAFNDWRVIGFVPGFGTTTDPKTYSFTDENLSAGTYQYRLKQIDFDGSFEYSNTLEVRITSPTEFSLEQNYPNPFNPSTIIEYSLASRQFVTLKIFNSLGEEVATLVNEYQDAGVHSKLYIFNSLLPSGVYFYQLKAGIFVETRKMILMK